MMKPKEAPMLHPPLNLDRLRATYIETIGPAFTPAELAKALRRIPQVTPDHLAANGVDRIVLGDQLQDEVVVPHRCAVELYYAMRAALTRRYGATNDSDARLLRMLHGIEVTTKVGKIDSVMLRPSASIGLLGPTGSGKTTLMDALAGLMPGCIRIENVVPGIEVIQIPILYIALTGDATVKNLLMRVIEAIDRQIGSDVNTRRLLHVRATTERLKIAVQQLCIQYGVGMIVVDEMQNLTSTRPGGAALVTNELLYLRDAVGIPLVFAGTYGMMKLLSSDARMTRRISQNGLFPITYAPDAKDTYWRQLCQTRWKCLVLRNVGPLTDGILEALFECTQGMTWALTAILCKAQRRMILEKRETLTADDIVKTYTYDATEMHTLVQAMATRDKGMLNQYPDLYHAAFDRKQKAIKSEEMELLRKLGLRKELSGKIDKPGAAQNDGGDQKVA